MLLARIRRGVNLIPITDKAKEMGDIFKHFPGDEVIVNVILYSKDSEELIISTCPSPTTLDRFATKFKVAKKDIILVYDFSR